MRAKKTNTLHETHNCCLFVYTGEFRRRYEIDQVATQVSPRDEVGNLSRTSKNYLYRNYRYVDELFSLWVLPHTSSHRIRKLRTFLQSHPAPQHVRATRDDRRNYRTHSTKCRRQPSREVWFSTIAVIARGVMVYTIIPRAQ